MYTLFYLVYCICSFFLLIPFVLCAAHLRLLAGSAHLARPLTMSTLRREAATQLWHKHGSYRLHPSRMGSPLGKCRFTPSSSKKHPDDKQDSIVLARLGG